MFNKQERVFMILILFKFWSVCWCFGIILIALRNDARVLFNEFQNMLFRPNIFAVITSAIVIYVFVPLTIPYSIAHILKK